MRTGRLLPAILALLMLCSACGREPEVQAEVREVEARTDPDVAAEVADYLPENTDTETLMPEQAQTIWSPWIGDLDGMIGRRVVRVVVPYGGYQYFYEGGRPRGATYDLLQKLESFINERLGRRNVKVFVLTIPVSRSALLPSLVNGNADLVAADLTVTEQRTTAVTFSRPLRTKVREIVIAGPTSAELASLDDLAGRDVVVRLSSSYAEHLQRLGAELQEKGLEAPVIVAADELLEAEDILEMVNAGMIELTVMDDYKARFWAQEFDNIRILDDLAINTGGEIAWAMRSDSAELAELIDDFLREYGKGTLVGNDTYNRYLSNASRVRCANTRISNARLREFAEMFKRYGDQYDFEWLMLAAQGYQESGLEQSRVSPAGAIGVMQIKPSTAADPNVGIDDVSDADANIRAGAKYMRFLADRYFSGPEFNSLNQWLLALAAYNAGPARINRLRREAAEAGYDPTRWFDNVEIIAARRIGRETVTYVSNIYKYFVGYQLTEQRARLLDARFKNQLAACADENEG